MRWVCALWALVLASSPAGAGVRAEPTPRDRRPRVLFVPPPGATLARTLEGALSAHADLVGLDALPAAPSDPEPARRAAEAVARAEALYGEARADEAITLLGDALRLDQQALAEAGDVAMLARLRLWEAICLAKSGREADAREAFQAARTLGAAPPDPLRFPPDVLALVPASPGEPLTTEIESLPGGAAVEVLGATAQTGTTPARFGLAAGQWLVRVRRPGYLPVARVVAAGGRVEVPLTRATGPALARSLATLRDAGALDTSVAANRALVVEALGADGRVDARLEGARLELARFDRGGRRLARAEGRAADAESLVAALFRDDAGTTGRGGEGGGSIFGQWWFWGSVGVVVAASVTVGLILANQEPDTVTYRPAP